MDWANNQISDRENKIAQGFKKKHYFLLSNVGNLTHLKKSGQIVQSLSFLLKGNSSISQMNL